MSDETTHSPEPWTIEDSDPYQVRDATGKVVAESFSTPHGGDQRRMVACVNACRGLSTAALEANNLRDALHALAVLVDDEEPAACRRLAMTQGWCVLRALGRLDP